MNIKKSILLRVRIAFLMVFLFALAVAYKVGHIQFAEGEKWQEMSNQMSFQYRPVKATRGNIYSDNGSLMATSLPFYRVAFDATIASDELFTSQLDSLSVLLASYFKSKSAEAYKRDLKNARESNRQYTVLSNRTIGYQEKKELENWPIFRAGRLKGGVIFEKVDKRFRPFSNLSQRTIGFINENQRGAGLEYSFNEQLAGRDGEALYQRIAGGSWKPVFDGTEIKSEEGYDIQTTIDINLQDVSETALLRALEYHDADYGVVAVMEVKTGQIKAISNLSRSSKGYYYERYNYAVGGLHEPGSTFKLATMIALLENTPLRLKDSIDTGDGIQKFYSNTVRDHEKGGYGKITVQESFEVSSNVAMAMLVDRYFGKTPDVFVDQIDKIGLSYPLGLQIKGEGIPKIKRPTDKDWSGITLPWMAYGYGLEITPIQTLALYNAVANGGKMIRPIFVKEVKRVDKTIEEFEPTVLNDKICSDETLLKLRLMLEGVVEKGTAQNIKNDHYTIAGKTGTAQILENGRYTKKYITSFVGYFPADRPKYSAVVLIKNPKGWYQYGSNVAAPVFKEIADNIYSRDIDMHAPLPTDFVTDIGVFPVIKSGYLPDLKLVCNQLGISNHTATDKEWVKAQISGSALSWKANPVSYKTVPNVTGMTLRDALYLLESIGMKVEVRGKGRVTSQSKLPGTSISNGTPILIKLS